MTEDVWDADAHTAAAVAHNASLAEPLPPRGSPLTDAGEGHSSQVSMQGTNSLFGSQRSTPTHDITIPFPSTDEQDPTPPTSSLSSQEDTILSSVVASEPKATVLGAGVEGAYSSSAIHEPQISRHHPSPDVILSGPKRTASGDVKRSSITSLNDLKTKIESPRASRTSTASSGSVMELSQQLRTRLNYAMVKVQHGWQTRSLEEVESLASQSPRSSTSGFPHLAQQVHGSPGSTVLSSDLHRKWSSSTSSDGGEALRPTQIGHPGSVNGLTHTGAEVTARRALAPPVDIVPGHQRRRAAPNSQSAFSPRGGPPPSSSSSQRSTMRPKQRTPSQNAAMEADAVETLLFMASPNNSGHYPPTFTPQESSLRSTQVLSSSQQTSTSTTSPLRSHFAPDDLLPHQSSVNVTSSPRKAVAFAPPLKKPVGQPYDRLSEIQRILDQYSDDDDEDEVSGGSRRDDLEEAFQIVQRRQEGLV